MPFFTPEEVLNKKLNTIKQAQLRILASNIGVSDKGKSKDNH